MSGHKLSHCYFKASQGINVALPDLVCKGNLLLTRGENDHVDQDHDGFGGRCHRMRAPRARWMQWLATPSTPTRPLSTAYRNLMNFRARQGSTAERGAAQEALKCT